MRERTFRTIPLRLKLVISELRERASRATFERSKLRFCSRTKSEATSVGEQSRNSDLGGRIPTSVGVRSRNSDLGRRGSAGWRPSRRLIGPGQNLHTHSPGRLSEQSLHTPRAGALPRHMSQTCLSYHKPASAWPARAGSGATTLSKPPGRTLPGRTRRCTAPPRTWRSSRPPSSGCCKITPTSSSATRTSLTGASRQWRTWGLSDERGKEQQLRAMTVRSIKGREILLKLALPAPRTAAGRN